MQEFDLFGKIIMLSEIFGKNDFLRFSEKILVAEIWLWGPPGHRVFFIRFFFFVRRKGLLLLVPMVIVIVVVVAAVVAAVAS